MSKEELLSAIKNVNAENYVDFRKDINKVLQSKYDEKVNRLDLQIKQNIFKG